MFSSMNRRRFLQGTLAMGAAVAAGSRLQADGPKKGPKLKKAVKFGMVQTKGSIQDKFALLKSLGFEGVELDSPSGINRDEAVAARDKTSLVIHGVVDSVHWKDTLSSPDTQVREKGLAALKTALEDCKFYGGDTVLLVPGVVTKDVTYEQCWERSTAEVKKAIPVADKLGVKIAIEVVWNDFITKPEQLVEYVDQFKTPTVGAYFDTSNMLKYGVKSGDWIRKLGKRMLKIDFKGFNIAKFNNKENAWVDIGEGDEDWPDVLKALDEVGYSGWATSEVKGGDEKWLKDVADRMNRVLGLS